MCMYNLHQSTEIWLSYHFCHKWNDHELPGFNPIISHPSITIAPYPIKFLGWSHALPHLHYERVHRVHRAQEPNRTEGGYWLLRGGGLYIPFQHENLGANLSLSLWIIRGPHFSGVLSKSSTLLTPSVPDKSSFINQFQSCATVQHCRTEIILKERNQNPEWWFSPFSVRSILWEDTLHSVRGSARIEREAAKGGGKGWWAGHFKKKNWSWLTTPLKW